MSVLITGGTGVIGSHVARQLLAKGERVVVTSSRGDLTLLADIEGDVESRVCDVRRSDDLRALMGRCAVDRVVHLAALLHMASAADPVAAVEVNVTATAGLYEACAAAGVRRLIFGSAKGAYGRPPAETQHPEYRPIREEDPAKPTSTYDATKLAAELVLESQRRRDGPEVASLRFATIYGPGKRLRHGPTSVLSELVELSMLGESVSVPAGGDQVDDMIYVEDAARGIVDALDAPALPEPLYNIGTGTGITLRAFGDVVARMFPDSDIHIGGGLAYMGDVTYGIMDIGRARRDLGFDLDGSPESGLRRYVEIVERLDLPLR